MPRTRAHTRRKARSNPRGYLSVMQAGYGFVKTAEGEFFIPRSKMGGAFDGDLVEIAPSRRQAEREHGAPAAASRRPSARVVAVIERSHHSVVGRYEVADPFGVVVPLDHRIGYDIFTMRADNPTIPDGALVRVRMVEYPARNTAATGVVEQVLGEDGDVHADVEAVLVRHKLDQAFPDEALKQAREARVDADQALAVGYRDITNRFAFTIDPFDARDFDDAVSVVARDDGSMLVGIHIADVSHYVPWDSALDKAARTRATSVYAADRVVPMLPEALSNDICSLVPGQARRVLTVDVVLDKECRVSSVEAYPAVFCSRARLSYDMAECFIQDMRAGRGVEHAYEQALRCELVQGAASFTLQDAYVIYDALRHLDRLAQRRAAARKQAGGIDIDSTEAKVVLDDAGEPVGVSLRRKTPATSCIEEAMILANECVATMLVNAHVPGIFRVHEPPAPDALESLLPVLQEFDVVRTPAQTAQVLAGNPYALQEILDTVKGRPEAELVSSLVLRSMQRAVYRPSCDGHFGLASERYCHFTSPIRRYPDLVVHRMLKAHLAGELPDSYDAQCRALPEIASQASHQERVAERAARETQELMLVAYMAQFVGEVFEGIVSGVATYGIFVRLENTVEGVVHMRDLGADYFALDPLAHKLTGQDSGRVFRLGQRVRVLLVDAPAHANKLVFRLAS